MEVARLPEAHAARPPGPALLGKGPQGMSTKYTGQDYDPEEYDLVEDGWDHDHCLFCWQSICDCGSENCTCTGFTDGDEWICESCHQMVIVEKKDPTTGPGGRGKAGR